MKTNGDLQGRGIHVNRLLTERANNEIRQEIRKEGRKKKNKNKKNKVFSTKTLNAIYYMDS